MPNLVCVSPIDGSVVAEHPCATIPEVDRILDASVLGFEAWRAIPLERRAKFVTAFIDAVVAKKSVLADELTLQMGRPRRYTEGEITGFEDRGRRMIALAEPALRSWIPPEKKGFVREVLREPVGPVLVLAPWNYPWLTAVNTVVPALMAGCSVVLKHSDQTPLVAERFAEAAAEAELPPGVFQVVHATHERTATLVSDRRVKFIAFTGSVAGGRTVARTALESSFVGVGLELGGKDPAYVAPDADLDLAVENLVDGSFFNSGQSCCAVERIYVNSDVYEPFVEKFAALTRQYVLGDPREAETTLGPVVRKRNAHAIQNQIKRAITAGATPLIAEGFAGADRGLPYLAPQVLVDVTDDMLVMREETFGPVVGIASCSSEAEAVRRMNDSPYGLTASIWTQSVDRARKIATALETGTVFMNRCDALDPDLAWVGVKDSGRGCTLSPFGYEQLTRPKSLHFRL